MTLASDIASDVSSVFMDTDEFAESVTLAAPGSAGASATVIWTEIADEVALRVRRCVLQTSDESAETTRGYTLEDADSQLWMVRRAEGDFQGTRALEVAEAELVTYRTVDDDGDETETSDVPAIYQKLDGAKFDNKGEANLWIADYYAPTGGPRRGDQVTRSTGDVFEVIDPGDDEPGVFWKLRCNTTFEVD